MWWLLARFVPEPWQWLAATAVAAIVIVVGIPASTVVARESGRTDPSHVVIDEVAGQMIALIAVPLRWKYLIPSLILFRAFDIAKPPPLRRLEKFPGGAGIMLDDVGAGLYALIVIQVLMHFRIFG